MKYIVYEYVSDHVVASNLSFEEAEDLAAKNEETLGFMSEKDWVRVSQRFNYSTKETKA